jgi:hypothetical protein
MFICDLYTFKGHKCALQMNFLRSRQQKKPRALYHAHGVETKKPQARSLPTASISTGKPVTSQAVGKPFLNSTTKTRRYFQIVQSGNRAFFFSSNCPFLL